jgi:hypothetical protein
MEFLDGFKWICLALFTAAAVIWLLDMIGKVTIRSGTQRTMLNASLGTTLLGGMASFAVEAFFSPTQADAAAPVDASSAAAASAAPPAADPSSASPSAPAPATPQPATCRPAAHPAALAEWAAVALDTPPTFRCAIGAPYPACMAELREKPRADISLEAARACGADLLAFRKTHVGPAYAAKIGYQDNLDAAEVSLRTARTEDEVKRREYVVNEIARMNGPLWKDFTALDQRSRADMLACQSNALRCLSDP